MEKVFTLMLIVFYCCTTSSNHIEINDLGMSKDYIFEDYEEGDITGNIAIHIISNSSHEYNLYFFSTDTIGERKYYFNIPAGQVDTLVGEEWYNDYTIIRYVPSNELASGSINFRVAFDFSLHYELDRW